MQAVISALLTQLLSKLDAEDVKDFVDAGLDKLEDKIAKTETKWDDALVQPLIDATRTVAGIEDKKYGTDKETDS
jgi:hypothetical protein